MKSPEQIAEEIVGGFSWTSNVMRNGRAVGQQYVVAEAIADVIQAERDRCERLLGAARDWRKQAKPRSKVAVSLVYAIDALDQD